MCRETYHPLWSLVYWQANAASALPHSAHCHSDTSTILLAASLPTMQVMHCVAEFDRGVALRLASLREQARGRAAREALEEARLQVGGVEGLGGDQAAVSSGGGQEGDSPVLGTGCGLRGWGGGLTGVQGH